MQAAAKKWATVAALAAALGGAWWWFGPQMNGQSADPSTAASGVAAGWGMEGPDGQSQAAPVSMDATLTPDQVRQKLFSKGSLEGTTPSGDWCVTTDQKLKPCKGLRGRFEYYILGLGEGGVTIGDIRGLIADESKREHGDTLSGEIMAIFDKYWTLRVYDWKNNFVQNDRSTWLPVFEEQRSVRRQILGQPWADAFFSEDEKHFQDYYAQLESGLPPPPDPGEPVPQMAPGKDPAAVHAERVARYGEEAAQRLAKVDEEWADWERRLAAAKAEWARIQGMNNLSPQQKQEEMQRYVNTNFQDMERVRISALLELP